MSDIFYYKVYYTDCIRNIELWSVGLRLIDGIEIVGNSLITRNEAGHGKLAHFKVRIRRSRQRTGKKFLPPGLVLNLCPTPYIMHSQ